LYLRTPLLSDQLSLFSMPCLPVNPEEYQEIGIYTPVEYNSNSLDFLSRNPTLFMRAADSVYMKGDSIIAKWGGGPYRLSNGDITHCGQALLVANIACKGNMPRISLSGFSLKKTKRGAFGRTKRFESIWVHPFGYPVLSRIGPVAAPEDCPETDLISLGHFATYLQWLTGSNDYGAPGAKDYYPVNSFIEYLLDFEVLGETDAYACGLCPGSYQFENSDEEFRAMRSTFESASKSAAEHYSLISAMTFIAAGEVLKGTVPLRVAIPYGCGLWETYVTRPTPKSDKLIVPQRGCNGWAYWLDSRGDACFSIEPEPDPDPNAPPPPPRLPDDGDPGGLGTGSSFNWPISDPPPAPGARSIGPSYFIPPDVPDPIQCTTPRCKVYKWTYKYVEADKEYTSYLNCLASSNATWSGWTHSGDVRDNWTNILYEPVCENGVVTHYALSQQLTSPGFTMDPPWYGPKVFVAPSAIAEDKNPPVQHKCSCSQWKITYYYVVKFAFLSGFRTMASTIVPGCPSGSVPTISPEGIIMCDGEAIGAVGFALSTFLYYRVSVQNVECIG